MPRRALSPVTVISMARNWCIQPHPSLRSCCPHTYIDRYISIVIVERAVPYTHILFAFSPVYANTFSSSAENEKKFINKQNKETKKSVCSHKIAWHAILYSRPQMISQQKKNCTYTHTLDTLPFSSLFNLQRFLIYVFLLLFSQTLICNLIFQACMPCVHTYVADVIGMHSAMHRYAYWIIPTYSVYGRELLACFLL